MRMGLPHVIVSDNGKEFDNQLNADITGLLGIQHRLITPYHPQVRVLVINYGIARDSHVSDHILLFASFI